MPIHKIFELDISGLHRAFEGKWFYLSTANMKVNKVFIWEMDQKMRFK